MASHGHTIFHNPKERVTVQIGHPAYIASQVKVPVVGDFRSLDVALHGQGAPLVPIGDVLLFKEFDFCLNLGGIANITYQQLARSAKGTLNEVVAYDICLCNQLLNYLASLSQQEFDKDGAMAKSGKVNAALLEKFSLDPYYQK